jgi:adenylate cyclase
MIDRPVASGGMGVIFRGLDRQTGALVGVKTMRISGGLERFEREIQILAALRHPGIVTYLGHGRVADELAADRARRRALELGPRLPESHVARAAVLAMDGDYQAAEGEYREAIRLNPNSFEAHYPFARNCFQMGKFVESVKLFRRAAEIRPEDFQCQFLLELPLERLGRFEEASAARREGIRRAERQLELEPNNARALILGACAFVSEGQHERGLDWARRARATAPEDPAVIVNVACVYARAGMKEEALACLEETFGRGLGKRDWVEQDPDYDPLRDDPRFQALLTKLS